MINRLSLMMRFTRLALVALLMALLAIAGVSVQPCYAHRPHDVVTQVELSPNYQQDRTVLIVVRGNLYRSSNGGGSWQRITRGLNSPSSLTDLELSLQNDALAFLGTNGDGVYRSLDKGLSWQNVSNGLDELAIQQLAVSPASSEIVLAASQSGRVYLTQNAGESWQQVVRSDTPIEAVSFSRNGQFAIAVNESQLLISGNRGETWQFSDRAASGLPLGSPVVAVQSDRSGELIWLATQTEGIFQTSDQGKTWTKLASSIPEERVEDLTILLPSSTTDTPLFVSTANTGLFYWNGQEWQPRTQGLKTDAQAKQMKQPNFTDLEFSPDGSVSFLAGFDGLFKSEDRGQQWQDLETLARGTIVALAISGRYANDSTLATVDYVGDIHISNDGGKTWKASREGLELPMFTRSFQPVNANDDPRRYFDLAFSPNYEADETLWATLLWTKLARSQDAGTSWSITALPKEQRGLTIVASPDFANDRTVYIATQQGHIYQSQDGGKAFERIGQVPSLQGNYGPSIAISPNFPRDRTLFVTGDQGIYNSTDAGKTWKPIAENTALAEAGKMQIAISPSFGRDRTLFVSTSNQGLFRSRDGGETWNQQRTLPGLDVELPDLEAIAISPNYESDQTLLLSVLGVGLYKSEDAGQSFAKIADASLPLSRITNVPSSGKPIVFSPNYANDKTIYGFGSAGSEIFKSTDSGKTWNVLAIQDTEPAGSPGLLSQVRLALYVYQGLLKKSLVVVLAGGFLYLTLRFLDRRGLLSFHSAQVQQYQQREPGVPVSWKALIGVLLVLRIFFSFVNLDEKPYNADEVRGFYRISGYTRDQIVEEVFNGEILTAEEILTYQVPTAAQDLSDTLHALGGNAEHTPLYYILSRFLMQVFNDSVTARILSVLFGLACLPTVYWLCCELFESRLTGWIAVGLIAVSPYQILLSQGAREYSLWALATLISTIVLLRALRKNDKSSWVIFTLSLIFGLYSHLFFVFVAGAYGLYLISLGLKRIRAYIVPFLISLSVASLAFLPWSIALVKNLNEIQEQTKWVSSRDSSLPILLKSFIWNLRNSFLDWNNSVPRLESYSSYLILGLLAVSLYFLIRFTPRKVWSLVVISIALIPLVLMTADLLLGGGRSLQSRYLLPSFLFAQLAIAYFLTKCIVFSSHNWERLLGKFVYLALVLGGIVSAIAIAKTPGWDYLDQGKTANALNLQMAPVINAANHPVVISEATHSFVFGLSHLTDQDVNFQLIQDVDADEFSRYFNVSNLAEQYDEVFVYFPDGQFKSFLEKEQNVELEAVFGNELYQAVPN